MKPILKFICSKLCKEVLSQNTFSTNQRSKKPQICHKVSQNRICFWVQKSQSLLCSPIEKEGQWF